MFYSIEGNLIHKTHNFAVIDAGGVGYKIYSTAPSLEAVGAVGSNAKMYTYLRVAEGIFDLYGFAAHEELNMFEMLLSVSGVGAKVAIAILSTISPSKFALSVVTNDVNAIKQAPGVGPKVAQRIILELKDKFKGLSLEGMTASDALTQTQTGDNDAAQALMVLGYSQTEAMRALSGIDQSLGLEEIIKLALKNLMRYSNLI